MSVRPVPISIQSVAFNLLYRANYVGHVMCGCMVGIRLDSRGS